MKIVIVGGGKVGYFLAQRLAAKNYVTLVDRDPLVAERLAETPDILVIHGDGCQLEVLAQAGVRDADVIAAVTGKDEDNLVICQIAKDHFKVARTVARINDPKNEKIFFQLGVDIAVDSTAIIARIIEEEVSLEDIISLFAFKKGKLSLVRIDLPETSPLLGRLVRDVALPPDTVLVAVFRNNEIIVPRGDFEFRSGDEVIALTKVENEGEVLSAFIGKLT